MNSQKGGQKETSENNLFEILTLRHQILENPESAEAHCDLGVAMIRNGDPENAIRYLKQATELNPKHDRSFFNLGRCYQSIGYIDNAINAYDRVVQLNPEDHQAWTNLAALFLQRDEVDEAIRLYQKAVSLDPSVHETWVDLGTTQFLSGYYTEAISSLNKAIELNDSNYHCWQQLGLCHYALKQADESIRGFEKALELNPGCHSTLNNLGNSYLLIQQPTQAEACYRKAIELNAEISDYWFNLGELLFNQNRREEAIVCFANVYKQDPEDQETLDYLVDAMLEISPAKALPYLQKQIKQRGESPSLLLKLGDLYQKLGNHEMEAKTRLKLSTSSPLNPENNLKLAELTLAQGKKELAYSFLKGSLPASLGKEQLWFRFSQSFRIENNPDEELNCLTNVVKGNPEHHLAWQRLGELALSREIPTKAFQYFNKALPVLKNHSQVWIRLTEALLKVSEVDLAVSSCFQLINLNLHTTEKWDYLFALSRQNNLTDPFCQLLGQKLLSEANDPKVAASFAKQIHHHSNDDVAESFLRALGQKWPGCIEILQEQVEFLLRTDQIERADPLVNSVLLENPDNYHFLAYLAQVEFQQQKFSSALDKLQKAQEIKPGHHLSWFLTGQIYLEQGEYELAMSAVEQAIALHPQNANAHNLRGSIFYKLNEMEEAALCYRTALALNRRDPASWQGLALIDQQSGNLQTAKVKWLRSVVCCRSFLPTWKNLADYFQQSGEEAKAKACLNEIENLKTSPRG